jgi:hypothetical protein
MEAVFFVEMLKASFDIFILSAILANLTASKRRCGSQNPSNDRRY